MATMARNTTYLLELDIDKVLENHTIEEILNVEKSLDFEIERKRVDLRSMVGDRYKDVLTASDAIISMKNISENIVDNIQDITNKCETIVKGDVAYDKRKVTIDSFKQQERTLVCQIRLAICLNEQIWIALDEDDNLKASQFYLLGQHIYTGLSLTKKSTLENISIINTTKNNLNTLRNKIFQNIKCIMENVEVTAEVSSCNLNALLLLNNQSSKELLNIFIEHRKTALTTVINSSHRSVRAQIQAMYKCLITTIHLLHDCFICSSETNTGLIWQQLHKIIGDSSPTTLSKINLPVSPLMHYIPDIIKQFRPKSKVDTEDGLINVQNQVENWLTSTKSTVENGLRSSLELITNVKGLHIIREEVLKIGLPANWQQICVNINLDKDFDVWYYFFQNLITERAKILISNKLAIILKEIEEHTSVTVDAIVTVSKTEYDLRWYSWNEEPSDISRTENKHTGLAMKTKGFSQNIVNLCNEFDKKYFNLLSDVSIYLNGNDNESTKEFSHKNNYVDHKELVDHLKNNCSRASLGSITLFIENYVKKESKKDLLVVKSLICARFLDAMLTLCPNFKKCCTFNGSEDAWNEINEKFYKLIINLWTNWLRNCVEKTKEKCTLLKYIKPANMIEILPKWDVIEIQEQTEEKVFNSYIKVPLTYSLSLSRLLETLNQEINYVLPHTLPKKIHIQFIEENMSEILIQYKNLLKNDLNQNQALQFLFDVKFITVFCIPRENAELISLSQEICDSLRLKIDPFDLDVFYSYLQKNVKRAVMQCQGILGCLMPSSSQLASIGLEKSKEQDKEPSTFALSVPVTTSWFPLLPITVPSQKIISSSSPTSTKKIKPKFGNIATKKSQDPTAAMRTSAAALFGGLTTDWFS